MQTPSDEQAAMLPRPTQLVGLEILNSIINRIFYARVKMGNVCACVKIEENTGKCLEKQADQRKPFAIKVKILQSTFRKTLFSFGQQENCVSYQTMMTAKENQRVFKQGQGFSSKSDGDDGPKEGNCSFSIQFQDEKIYLSPQKDLELIEVVRSSEARQLQVGSQITIGRTCLRVREFMSAKKADSLKKIDTTFRSTKVIESDEFTECRFCFQKSTRHNPLIHPCNCNGSLNHIHRECLSKWLFGDDILNLEQNNKQLTNRSRCLFKLPVRMTKCEICNADYYRFIYTQILRILKPCELDFVNPDQYYLLMEVIPAANTNARKEFFYCKLDRKKKDVLIGRSSQCHYQSDDSSISKLNSTICVSNGKLMVKDVNSRYGTGVKVQVDPKNNKARLHSDRLYRIANLTIELTSIFRESSDRSKHSIFKRKTSHQMTNV